MEYLDYLEKKKTLQKVFIDFIDNEENVEENFEKLVNLINDQNIKTDESEFRLFIRFIENISSEHHRTKHFFIKIEKILLLFREEFGKYLTIEETFNIFKYNKRMLLFLLQNEFVKMNFELSYFFTNYKHFYPEYFCKEIKEFFPSFADLYCDSKFEQNRLNGENDISYCQIIRNDSISEFIQYINSNHLPLDTTISASVFETNSFLLFLEPSLIEYSAFFGSIKIFKYLTENKAKMTPKLWLYSIHGRNIEILKILKEYQIKPQDITYKQCLEEAIRCHHYEIIEFIQNEFKINDFDKSKNISYYNFISFPEDLLDNRNNFFYFCKYDYAFFVKQFLKHKNIDINFKLGDIIEGTSFRITSFLSAVNSDNHNIVKILLNQNEIDVNFKAIMCHWSTNETILDALMISIFNHNSKMVSLLLNNKKINVNGVTIGKHFYENSLILYEEKYPLHKVVLDKNMEILKLLLSHQNIDVNVKYKSVKYYSYSPKNIINSWEKTALQFAIEIEDIDIIKILLNHPKIDVNCKSLIFDAEEDYNIESSPLYNALNIGNIEIIKLLLSHPNIDVNQILLEQIEEIPSEKTILNYAIQSEQIEIVKLLLSHPKIDVNKISIIKKNDTKQILPLDVALTVSTIEIFALLLEQKNIDINLKVKSQSGDLTTIYGILISAITTDNIDFVKLLLNRKDINVNDIIISDSKNESHIEKSILSFAVDAGNENIVNILLDHPDIDVNVKDIERKNNGSTIKIISLLHKVFSKCSIEIITKVLNHKKIDINVKSYNKTSNGYSIFEEELTTLYVAIYNGRLDLVQLLLVKTNLDNQLNSAKIDYFLYPNDIFQEEVATSLQTAISLDKSEIFCFLLNYLIKNEKLTDDLDELLIMTDNKYIQRIIRENINKQK